MISDNVWQSVKERSVIGNRSDKDKAPLPKTYGQWSSNHDMENMTTSRPSLPPKLLTTACLPKLVSIYIYGVKPQNSVSRDRVVTSGLCLEDPMLLDCIVTIIRVLHYSRAHTALCESTLFLFATISRRKKRHFEPKKYFFSHNPVGARE